MSYVMSHAIYLDTMSYTTISYINFRIRCPTQSESYTISYTISYSTLCGFVVPFFGGVASPDPGCPDVRCVPLQQLPALRLCFQVGKDTILQSLRGHLQTGR
jgi:hypothetical protein